MILIQKDYDKMLTMLPPAGDYKCGIYNIPLGWGIGSVGLRGGIATFEKTKIGNPDVGVFETWRLKEIKLISNDYSNRF